MSDCEFLKACPFFNDELVNMPIRADFIKSLYCRGDWAKCARFMIRKKLPDEGLPSDLYPDHTERAYEILAKSSI